MTLRVVLLTYLQPAHMCMTFQVVSFVVPKILVAGLVRLVSEMVVSLF